MGIFQHSRIFLLPRTDQSDIFTIIEMERGAQIIVTYCSHTVLAAAAQAQNIDEQDRNQKYSLHHSTNLPPHKFAVSQTIPFRCFHW